MNLVFKAMGKFVIYCKRVVNSFVNWQYPSKMNRHTLMYLFCHLITFYFFLNFN